MAHYGTMECPICHKQTSAGGAARTSHLRSHVRDGSAREEVDADTGALVFIPTGQKPKERDDYGKNVHWWGATHSSMSFDPRKPVKAEIRGDKVLIFCRHCGQKSRAGESAIDQRFYRILCEGCGKMTLFSKRDAGHHGGVIVA